MSQKSKSNVIIISRSRCTTLQQLNNAMHHNWPTILALCFLWETDSQLNWSTHKSLHIYPKDDVLTSVTPAKCCQRLHVIKSFTQSIALTRKMFIIVIKKTIQRNHMFAISALLLEDAIFDYWPPPRFSLIPNTDLKDGSFTFMVSYVSSTVLFFSI